MNRWPQQSIDGRINDWHGRISKLIAASAAILLGRCYGQQDTNKPSSWAYIGFAVYCIFLLHLSASPCFAKAKPAMKAMKAMRSYNDLSYREKQKFRAKMTSTATASTYWRTSNRVGVSPKVVRACVEGVFAYAAWQMCRQNSGTFMLGGLIKLTLVERPATNAREGRHPFTKEPHVFKAKPATNIVRITPLKKLKRLANRKFPHVVQCE